MKSRTTAQFCKLFTDLSEEFQEQIRTTSRHREEDPSHPSLRFKKVHTELSLPLPTYKTIVTLYAL